MLSSSALQAQPKCGRTVAAGPRLHFGAVKLCRASPVVCAHRGAAIHDEEPSSSAPEWMPQATRALAIAGIATAVVSLVPQFHMNCNLLQAASIFLRSATRPACVMLLRQCLLCRGSMLALHHVAQGAHKHPMLVCWASDNTAPCCDSSSAHTSLVSPPPLPCSLPSAHTYFDLTPIPPPTL